MVSCIRNEGCLSCVQVCIHTINITNNHDKIYLFIYSSKSYNMSHSIKKNYCHHIDSELVMSH